EGHAQLLLPGARPHHQHGLRRRLDHDVPALGDVQHLPRPQHAPRRQRQRELPPPPPHPPPPPPPPPPPGIPHLRSSAVSTSTSRSSPASSTASSARASSRTTTTGSLIAQNRKYRWAMGRTRAGSHASSTPSARTAYVSGSTSIRGNASLCTMSRLPIPRHPRTATAGRASPSRPGTPAAIAAADMNVTDVEARARPSAPNIGR